MILADGFETPAECVGPTIPVATRIEILPGGVLLTPSDPERQLVASVYDQCDKPMQATVVWDSTAPAGIAVAGGIVTATTSVGSAVVSARADAASASVLVVAAEPVPGALVVTDDQIVGDPVPLDDAAPFGIGFRYNVTLVGVAPPALGTIVLASGDKAVAGRVVAVAGAVITLEMVPIDEVFAALDIAATLDLSTAVFTPSPETALVFASSRAADGSVRLSLRPGWPPTGALAVEPLSKYTAGPFECEAEFGAVEMSLERAELSFTPDLTYDIVWNSQQHTLVVGGRPTVSLEVTPVLAAALSGELTCKFTFGELQVPVPGPLGLFIGAVVPLGAGFKIAGELPLGGVGAEMVTRVGADFQVGFDCQPDCIAVQTLDPIFEGGVTPRLPAALEGIRLDVELTAFLFANLKGGTRFRSAMRVDALKAQAGLRLEGELASEATQAADAAFAASYASSFVASLGAGDDFKYFLELAKVDVAKFTWPYELPLGRSPIGVVTADRATFEAGDTVNFDVALEPQYVTFPGLGYNVVAVRVYRRSPDSLILANEITATADQTQFRIPWVATVSGAVGANFVAFVQTKMPVVPRLEVGDATGAETEIASLVVIEERVDEESYADDTYTTTYRRVETTTLTAVLQLVASSSTDLEYEVIGGSIAFDGSSDFERIGENLGSGDCTYNETIEDHSTSDGNVTTTSGSVDVELVSEIPDMYRINVDEWQVTIETDGVWSAHYEFLGSRDDCRTQVDDPYQDSDLDWLGEFYIEGTADPTSPKIFAGSRAEVNGTSTVTTTWSLVRP